MALKHSLQVESTSWLVVTNRNYYNGFSSRETLLWAQGHLASPQEPQDIRTLPRPFMTDEEDHTGAMTYPGSQNINGSKAGLRGLGTCQVFPRASMYNWASYALCSLEAICISPGFPFLLVKSWPHAKWPGFCLCVREEVISRTWLTPVLWEAFSELQIGLYIPHFWFSVALWVVNSITARTSDSLRAGSSLIYFVSMVWALANIRCSIEALSLVLHNSAQ